MSLWPQIQIKFDVRKRFKLLFILYSSLTGCISFIVDSGVLLFFFCRKNYIYISPRIKCWNISHWIVIPYCQNTLKYWSHNKLILISLFFFFFCLYISVVIICVLLFFFTVSLLVYAHFLTLPYFPAIILH